MPSNAKKRWRLKQAKDNFVKTVVDYLKDEAKGRIKIYNKRSFWTSEKEYFSKIKLGEIWKSLTPIGSTRVSMRDLVEEAGKNLEGLLQLSISRHCRAVYYIKIGIVIGQPFFDRYGCRPGLPTGHTPLLKVFKKTFQEQVYYRDKEDILHNIRLPPDVINHISQYVCPTKTGF